MLEPLRTSSLYLSIGLALALTSLTTASCSRTGEVAGGSSGVGHSPAERATRGRLSVEGVDPKLADLDADALQSMELALWQTARQTRSPKDVERLARFYAHTNRYSKVITALESTPFNGPATPTTLSVLAVAYLERGTETSDPFDLLLAAEAALEAVRLQPDLAEGRYNFALALDTLSLVRQAQAAWESYLELDTTSEWAAAVRERLTAMESPPDEDRWAAVVTLLKSSGSNPVEPVLEQEIIDLAGHAYLYAERDLFPRWAEATLEGDTIQADRHLELAARLADVLARAGADGTIRGAVNAIWGAQESTNPEAVLQLARAHRDFSRGVALRSQNCSSAAPLFESAGRDLLHQGDPYGHWATLYRTICRYGEDNALALQELAALRDRIAGLGLSALEGRVDWMLGLVAARSGNYAEALVHYLDADKELADARDAIAMGGIRTLRAEANQELGRPHEAWVQRLVALEAAARGGEPKALVRALEDAVAALTEEGRLDLALLFSDELLVRAEEWESSGTALPTALWKQAMLLHRTGDDAQALEELDTAASMVAARSSELRDQAVLTQVNAVRSLVSAAARPAEAIELVGSVLEEATATGQESWHPILFEARARAHLARGDLPSARADLEQAIQFVEAQRFATDDEFLRISFFETVQDLYDSMVALQARSMNDAGAALEFADRSRSRGLLDRVVSSSGSATPAGTATDLAASLPGLVPEGIAVIEYGLLEDELLTWVIDEKGLRLVREPVSSVTLERQVDRLRKNIEQPGPLATVERLASDLYDSLVRPIQANLDAAETVVIVPDRFLSQVPFGALYNQRTGRYWIEEQAFAVAPSSALLAAGDPPDPRPLRERRTALVVADPTLDAIRFPQLAKRPLEGAAREGPSIADLYAGSELLLGAAATPEVLLERLDRHPVLHVASHAVLDRRNPHKSVLALAASPGNPNRGALTAEDLVAGNLDGLELVFMAACTTAPSFPGSEREGLAGFVRELLGAGIPAVVASLWEVDDAATSILATSFHRELSAGVDPIAALRAAQLRMLEDPPDPLFRSPVYWAGFQAYVGRLPAGL